MTQYSANSYILSRSCLRTAIAYQHIYNAIALGQSVFYQLW
ncbi:MAG: hypothetical protein ACKO7R_04870 [Pseudanabaena sp.]